MSVEIRPTENDDPEFIRLLTCIVEGVLADAKPSELYVVAVDNWFDHKWLGFSGIGVVPFEFQEFMHRYDAALAEFRQDKVTLPPFSPNRVIRQRYFHKQGGAYEETEPPVDLHKRERQSSEKNLHRRIVDISESGSFIWYSSNTLSNARASIMTYTVKKHEVETWFAAFENESGWKLLLTKGINRDRVHRFLTVSR